jgi:PAS domain S-box-containing protein
MSKKVTLKTTTPKASGTKDSRCRPLKYLQESDNVLSLISAMEKLKESEEKYRSLFDSMSEVLLVIELIHDKEGKPVDFVVRDINKAILRQTGKTREEVINRTGKEFLGYIEQYLLDTFDRIAKTGNPEYFTYYGKTVGKWYESYGWKVGKNTIATLSQDITERKRIEQELAAKNHQIQSIIDKASSIIYAFDLEHRFLLANITLAKLFNSTPEKMMGKRRHYFMPKEDADWHEANDSKVMKAGKVLEFEEYSNLKDRNITWLTTKFPLYDIAGQLYGVAGISMDISERKRLEDDLKKNNEALENRIQERTKELRNINEALLKSNKDLENFAYIASHDLQEPLRMVTSFTQLLYQRYSNQLDQDARDYIGFAVEGAKRMYELINGLLAYSRIYKNEETFTEVDLNKVIEDVRANLNVIIKERNCRIDYGDLPVVFANKNQMLQLLQNLVSNGIKYSDKDPNINISVLKEDSKYIFSVKDEGIGIESQYFDKIFEIFKRLHQNDKYSGTGIGLAICKRIVENHRGRIWVESEPGQGSTFYFTLPEGSIKL